MALNRVRITSQGKGPWDVQIFDADTGEPITGVSRVEIVLDPNTDEFVAKLSFLQPILDLPLPAEIAANKD